MEQIFLPKRPYFKLRTPRSSKPTTVYLVFFANGKQYKISTGVKVLPSQWSDEHQVAIVSNLNSKLDNRNNEIVNKKIEEVKQSYRQFVDIVSELDKMPAEINLPNIRCKDMLNDKKAAVKEKPIAVECELRTALEENKQKKRSRGKNYKENTARNDENKLNRFIDYIRDNKLGTTIDAFSQKTFDAYFEYLLNETKLGNDRINQLMSIVKTLVNEIISKKFGIAKIENNNYLQPKSSEDTRNFPLTEEQVQSIKDCTTFEGELEEFRNLFLFQISTGLRVSDLYRFIKGEGEIVKYKGDEFLCIKTKKCDVEAAIPLDEANQFLGTVKNLKYVDTSNKGAFEKKYGRRIKKICETLGLNKEIKYVKGREPVKEPLYKVVSSHCARHTFIVHKLTAEHWTPEYLKYVTGHTDNEMIQKVYSHLSPEDKMKIVARENEKRKREKQSEGQATTVLQAAKPKKSVGQALFALDTIDTILKQRDRGISTTDLEKSVVKAIKTDVNNSTWDKIRAGLENNPVKEEFITKVKSIDSFVWDLVYKYADSEIYKFYQSKLTDLGIEHTEYTEEDIEYRWNQWDREQFEKMRNIEEHPEDYQFD